MFFATHINSNLKEVQLRLFQIPFILLLTTLAGFSENKSDEIPELVKRLTSENQIERAVTLTELYEKSHYSEHTLQAVHAIEKEFKHMKNQELKAEAGTVLIEFYRQLGALEKIPPIIQELGFISGWQVLGPLKPDHHVSEQWLLDKGPLKAEGLNREVQETAVPAYGEQEFFTRGAGHFGYYNANLALFPNQLVSAVFRSWFYSDGKTPIRLGLGWHHRLQVWINKSPVFKGEVDQIPHVDQKVIFFKIKKGWHQISLRTESSSDDMLLGFYARLTNVNGQPVQSTMVRKSRRGKKPSILNSNDFETPLIEMAGKQGPKQLAGIMLQKEITQLEHTPKNLLKEAFQQQPDKWTTEKLLQLDENPNKRWAYLSKYLETHPEDAWALSELGRISLSQARFWEARQYAQRALKTDPEYWQAVLLECNTLSHMNLYGEALRKTEELHQKMGDIPWILMDLCDLYDQMGLDTKMDHTLNKIRSMRHSSDKFNERRIQYLIKKEQTEKLNAFFRELVREKPDNLSIFIKYAHFLKANGEPVKAENLLREKVELFPENPYLLKELGQVQLALQNKPAALENFRNVMTIDPQNPEIEKLIQLYESEDDAFYAKYRQTAQEISIGSKDGVRVNLHNTVKKISSSGQSSVYYQIIYEIAEEQGIKELAGHSFSYAPLRQRAEIIKAEVIRENETILLSHFNRARLSNPSYRMYYDLVAYQIPFPNLQVGDRVYLEYRVDDIGPKNIYGSYFGDLVFFKDNYPTQKLSYTLILPKDLKFNYRIENMEPVLKQTISEGNAIYEWELNEISIIETEPMMPAPETQLPYLSYSSFESWHDMAEWYHQLIDEQLKLDPETVQIVRSLVDGVQDQREIVKRIHEFVITHTRYVALEFGIHGYKPYQVNQVCSRQFGDCKDKASLLVAMLREAGVEASIAIVRTSDRGQIAREPANLSYFNHAIAYVPKFELFLDGTAEYSGIDELPEMDQGAEALVVDREGQGQLMTIPVSRADSNQQTRQMHIRINRSGQSELSGKLFFSGVHAPFMRRYMEGEGNVDERISQLLTYQIPGFKLKKADILSRELNQPIECSFDGEVQQLLVEKTDGSYALPLGLIAPEYLPLLAPTAERDFPLLLGIPENNQTQIHLQCHGREIIKIPENLVITAYDINLAIEFELKSPHELLIHYQLTFPKRQVSIADYEAFRSNLSLHDKKIKQELILK
ncbi:MAG: hypothetical protein CR997_03485 [Acidobacteria bacterium]|nr:MAG: hypothetical protein CR997_03485 [Acidobacteriota bacterium]